jgi:hypothetical protein
VADLAVQRAAPRGRACGRMSGFLSNPLLSGFDRNPVGLRERKRDGTRPRCSPANASTCLDPVGLWGCAWRGEGS